MRRPFQPSPKPDERRLRGRVDHKRGSQFEKTLRKVREDTQVSRHRSLYQDLQDAGLNLKNKDLVVKLIGPQARLQGTNCSCGQGAWFKVLGHGTLCLPCAVEFLAQKACPFCCHPEHKDPCQYYARDDLKVVACECGQENPPHLGECPCGDPAVIDTPDLLCVSCYEEWLFSGGGF